MNGGLTFLIVLLVLALLATAAYLAYRHLYRPRHLGSPTTPSFPSSSSRAISPKAALDWCKSKYRALRNPQTRSGAGYEAAGYEGGGAGYAGAGAQQRGFRSRGAGALDPDEAWDASVAVEADLYPDTGYAGAKRSGGTAHRVGQEEEEHEATNPFADENELPLGRVSPRPVAPGGRAGEPLESSSGERRSMFRENV